MVKVAITCDIDEEERIRLLVHYHEALVHYHEAVAAAGAVPLIVPPYTVEKDLSVWLDCVRPDGLMLSGGADINPEIYGEKPVDGLGRVSVTRDAYELSLLKLAIGRGIPHQCVDRPGRGLIVSGRSGDGVVEALETADGKVMAVQFHPERMVRSDARMAGFFSRWCGSLK